jgi:hypothetical protein
VNVGFLTCALAAVPFPNHLYEILILAAATLGLLLAPVRPVVRCPPNLLPCLALAVAGVVGTWTSHAALKEEAIEWFIACLWYWTMFNGWRQPGGRRAVWNGLLVSSLVFAAWAALDVAHGVPRAAGPTLHANMLALLGNIWFPPLLLWGSSKLGTQRGESLVALAAGAALGLAVLATRSRTGVLVAGLNLLLMVAIRYPRGKPLRVATAVSAGALLFLLLAACAHVFLVRQATAQTGNLTARWKYDRLALAMLLDHPGGVGTGRFQDVCSEPRYARLLAPYKPDIAHCAAGQIAAECGWAGLIVALALCLRCIARAWKQSRRPGPDQALHQGILLAYGAVFMTGFVESVMWMEPCNLALLTLAAISAQAPEVQEPEELA